MHTEDKIEVKSSFEDIKEGKITLNKSSLKVNYQGGMLFFEEYDQNSEWKSLQFHFHAPSEHTINGKQYGAELHIVFKGITYKEEIAVI